MQDWLLIHDYCNHEVSCFAVIKIVYEGYQFCCESKVLFVVDIKQGFTKASMFISFIYLSTACTPMMKSKIFFVKASFKL